jgi:endogenous inhibitor of DNA gyrase (YacG/DUF329 family)
MPVQKNCPTCKTTHIKRGPYCSRSCGNIRVHSEEDKAIRSQKLTEYHQTPEGAATREKSSRIMTAKRKGEEWEEISSDEFAVGIPDVTDYSADYDDTWQRAEKW